MAKFGQSQNGQLTVIFENFNDLAEFGETIAHLLEKYESQSRTNPILVVFAVPVLEAVPENLL